MILRYLQEIVYLPSCFREEGKDFFQKETRVLLIPSDYYLSNMQNLRFSDRTNVELKCVGMASADVHWESFVFRFRNISNTSHTYRQDMHTFTQHAIY